MCWPKCCKSNWPSTRIGLVCRTEINSIGYLCCHQSRRSIWMCHVALCGEQHRIFAFVQCTYTLTCLADRCLLHICYFSVIHNRLHYRYAVNGAILCPFLPVAVVFFSRSNRSQSGRIASAAPLAASITDTATEAFGPVNKFCSISVCD